MTSAAELVARRLEERGRRAEALASEPGSGQLPLRFAAGLFRAQAQAAAAVLRVHAERPLTAQWTVDCHRLRAPLEPVRAFLAAEAPEGLKGAAQALGQLDAPTWQARLGEAWGQHTEGTDFLARAVLRPWAAVAAALELGPGRDIPTGSGHCPRCGAAPTVGFRRAEANTDGAGRWLCCGTCGTEWQTSRIRCPACGETDPTRLPSWQREGEAGTRVEACDACHGYLKSVDLTVDARRIPEVDELCTLALDLWAQEQGYRRLEPGLAGV